MRYMQNQQEIGNENFRTYMKERNDLLEKNKTMAVLHENSLADCIKHVLEVEEVADIKFNKDFITPEQMKLIMMRAARTSDQIELFYALVEEVCREALVSTLLPEALKEVDTEVIVRENALALELDPVLANYTLRQLRAELKRYGKSEADFRKELDGVNPPNGSQGIRGARRKQCLIRLIKEERTMHGVLGKDDADIGPATERPWTNIIRFGTARGLEDGEEYDYQVRRRKRMNDKQKKGYEKKIGHNDDNDNEEEDSFLAETEDMQVVVDPYVRNQLVGSVLSRYSTARELRTIVKELGGIVSTPAVKGEERRKKLANNLVDYISKNDDLFRAWKAVLLSGGGHQHQGGMWNSEVSERQI